MAQAGERFALLFEDKTRETRRLVTDTACLEVVGMVELDYLDISPDGDLFLRSRGGKKTGGYDVRVFFDGERLMSDPHYKTAVGSPVLLSSGSLAYEVPCTGHTIIDGYVYRDEFVEYLLKNPTVAVSVLDVGILEFCDESGKTRRVHPGMVFLPGERTVLPDGFIRVGNSECIAAPRSDK